MIWGGRSAAQSLSGDGAGIGLYGGGKGLAAIPSPLPHLHNTRVMEWPHCYGSIPPGKSEAPPKPGDWEIDAPAMSVGIFREVWCLRCPGSDKILSYLASPAS